MVIHTQKILFMRISPFKKFRQVHLPYHKVCLYTAQYELIYIEFSI